MIFDRTIMHFRWWFFFYFILSSFLFLSKNMSNENKYYLFTGTKQNKIFILKHRNNPFFKIEAPFPSMAKLKDIKLIQIKLWRPFLFYVNNQCSNPFNFNHVFCFKFCLRNASHHVCNYAGKNTRPVSFVQQLKWPGCPPEFIITSY